MPLFHYRAVDQRGKSIKSKVNAESIEQAREWLCKQQIFVTRWYESKEKFAKLAPSPSFLQHFTRDLYLLLKAGLPLYETLLTLEEKYRRSKMHGLILSLCHQVKLGKTFSQALRLYPRGFSSIYVSMVQAGEESGSLTEGLGYLAALIARENSIKKKLISAMIYPCFLLTFCLAVVIFLFFFLIPSMQVLFEGRTLHPMTKTVLFLSHWLREHALLLSLLFVSTLGIIVGFVKTALGKKVIHVMSLKLPLCSRLITEIVLARFCRILSVLLKGGGPLLCSVRLARGAIKHVYFDQAIAQAERKICEGRLLSQELQAFSYIPQLMTQLLSVGEESGNLQMVTQHIADIYDESVKKSLMRLTSLLQPIMLLFLGVVVAVILLSVLLPLTDVGSMV